MKKISFYKQLKSTRKEVFQSLFCFLRQLELLIQAAQVPQVLKSKMYSIVVGKSYEGTDMPVIITRNIIYAYLTYDSNLYPTFICFE